MLKLKPAALIEKLLIVIISYKAFSIECFFFCNQKRGNTIDCYGSQDALNISLYQVIKT